WSGTAVNRGAQWCGLAAYTVVTQYRRGGCRRCRPTVVVFLFEVGSFIQEMYVKRKSSSVRLISFILFIAVTLTAQTGGSWLKGQVTDPSCAVVVQANITVKYSSGQIFNAASNRQGAYEIKGLPPGKYMLIATSAGFTPYELTD